MVYADFVTARYFNDSTWQHLVTSEASRLYFCALAIGIWYSGARGISWQRGILRRDGMMEAKQL
jgi:hypothetical protein